MSKNNICPHCHKNIEVKEIICPCCNEVMDGIEVEYSATVMRSFNVENEELYLDDYGDDDLCVEDLLAIYCRNCKKKLPKEFADEIRKLNTNY